MSLLNVGARALLANQVALQTAGHNIANVSTPGYSRQSAVMQTVQGQFTGSGYIGQGVDVRTILRNQSELLTRQAAAAGSTQSADAVRAERLRQLQEVFSGGTTGLGAAINDMMNSFSDVVSSPTDITARTVALTRMDETAARMRSASERIDEIQYTVSETLGSSITADGNIRSPDEPRWFGPPFVPSVARGVGSSAPVRQFLSPRWFAPFQSREVGVGRTCSATS